MRRSNGLVLAFALAVSTSGELAAATVRHIVVLEEGTEPAAVGSLSRQLVDQARRAIPSLGLGRRFEHALRGFVVELATEDAARLDALRGLPQVAFVAEDAPVELHGQRFQPGMERLRVRWNALTRINDADDARIDADIAILDTGIDATHPDLNVFRSVSFVPGGATSGDPHGHGTHVAGIAAAIDDAAGVFGVAPGARLWSVQVVGAGGVGDTSAVIAGLDYVAAHASEIDVVNLSLGGAALGDDGSCGQKVGDPLHLAVCRVVDAGVVVVASAGNHPPYGRDASLVRPAAYDEVITVSAVVETDGAGPGAGTGAPTIHGPDNTFAGTFSNYGWDVDLAAPGVDVVSTWPGGGYAGHSGTSAAAPHVAGAAALWIARHGKPADRAGVIRVRDELVRLGFPQAGPDQGFAGDKETYAEPLLDVGAIDPDRFDPVEPQLVPDREVYRFGHDRESRITLDVRDEIGRPLDGLPGNAVLAYLRGTPKQVGFEELGAGRYALTVDLTGLLPGDHDFTAVVRNLAGFRRSAGCRIVVRDTEPRIRLHELAFLWPVMSRGSFFTINPLHAAVMDENGAPVLAPPQAFETAFSGAGPALVWSYPEPDWITGVFPGITYGAHRTEVSETDALPAGAYRADVTVTIEGHSDSASATFEIDDPDPALAVELSANLTVFDFTQPIPPPPLDLTAYVRSEWSMGVAGLTFSLNQPFVVRIDGAVVPAAVTEDLRDAGVYSIRLAIGELAHGSHVVAVDARDERGLEAASNAVTVAVLRDTGPCANPGAAPDDPDADGDGVRDDCDNCPSVANRSQRNTGGMPGAGPGDACTARPVVRVSSSASDDPDFFSIQDALDAAIPAPQGVRVEILPGLGPYVESLVLARDQPFVLVGLGAGSERPIVHSPAGPVIELRSAGDGPIAIHDLVLRGNGPSSGQTGLRVGAPLASEGTNLSFEDLEVGIELFAGDHRFSQLGMGETVGTGLVVGDAAVTLSRSEIRGVAAPVRMTGSAAAAEIDHLLLVGDGLHDGIVNRSALNGALRLRHSTLVHCATAVQGNPGNTAIEHSILWGNGASTLGVRCVDVAWSDLGNSACGGSNRSVDPRFANPATGDYRLQPTSPLLEHGPNPSTYSGTPCLDLDGAPRLSDHDGDGLARIDPGAYERRNAAPPPEVTGVVFTGPATLAWKPEPAAVAYHVYRARLSALGYSMFGACEDGFDVAASESELTDPTLPPAGDGFSYMITTVDGSGRESTLGSGSCAERSNFASCR